jgi:lysine biosynthesis protein LysW
MSNAYCPDCDGRIQFKPNYRVGQIITCPECENELEVISTDPPELDWAYDWSWEDEEEEDD